MNCRGHLSEARCVCWRWRRAASRNGVATQHREWQVTVLIAPREQVEIAFVADNPGDWMFHCHILEHQESGMMGVIKVV